MASVGAKIDQAGRLTRFFDVRSEVDQPEFVVGRFADAGAGPEGSLGDLGSGVEVALFDEFVPFQGTMDTVVDLEQFGHRFRVFGFFFAHLLDLGLCALKSIGKILSK